MIDLSERGIFPRVEVKFEPLFECGPMTENIYGRWMRSDFDVCFPIIDKQQLDEILQETPARVFSHLGPGPLPVVGLDLEHFQVVDYSAFENVSDEQRELISALHASEPVRAEEMLFLGLRSLFQLTWPEPKSNEDLIFALAYDSTLSRILVDKALDLASAFRSKGARLPYWGRLSFLRTMGELPTDNIERFGLNTVSCTLLKRAKFNATTFPLAGHPVIGINYALEPVLKQLNRYLLHFFSTDEMAGPKRLVRAWNEIVSIVLYFWSDVTATELTNATSILFDEKMSVLAHSLTVSQVDFILMHELGHIALDHPARLKAETATGNATVLRHELEFAADAFALGLMRSKLVKKARAASQAPGREGEESKRLDYIEERYRDYQSDVGGVYLLFIYMDFVQRAGELLLKRLAGRIKMRERMDTHPRASDRLNKLELMNLGEHLYTSPIERYGREFLQSVLSYASALDDQSFAESVLKHTR